MNEANVYADGFCTQFAEEGDLMEFLRNRMNHCKWLRKPTKALRLIPMEDEKVKKAYAGLPQYEEILSDTKNHTQLMLKVPGTDYPGEYLPVRDCAIHTILSRAGVKGDGLKRLDRKRYARIVNMCLQTAKGLSLIRLSDGKVAAVHGGDVTDYKILNMEQIFQETIFYLYKNYPGTKYIESSGSYDHSSATAMWELSGNPELVDAYQSALKQYGIKRQVYAPALRLSTSDVAAKSVTISQMLLCDSNNQVINLGDPIRISHSGEADIEYFKEQLNQIYPRYKQAIENLEKLLEIPIEHPVNTMIGLINKLDIGKKIGSEAVDLFVAQSGEGPTNAHEIYYALNEVLFFAACRGSGNAQLLRLEEKLMRMLKYDWSEFDVSGTVAWK